jgi:transposase
MLRNSLEWSALPRSLGAKSTIHDRFQEWNQAGVFEKIWTASLELLNYLELLDLEWQAMDGTMVKAPLGGEKNGQESDRSRQAWLQTQLAHRWERFTTRTRVRRRESARHEAHASNP